MSKYILSLALAVAMLSAPLPRAWADSGAGDSLRFKTPAVCTTEGGSVVNVSPGRYLPETTWLDLEADYKEKEEALTRLEAENKSLRSDAGSVGWGLGLTAAAFVAGGLATKYLWGN